MLIGESDMPWYWRLVVNTLVIIAFVIMWFAEKFRK
jgi:hypothetical protein